MPTYRLITGYGVTLESFEADDDVVARVCGRELAANHAASNSDLFGRPGNFVVERHMEDRWAPIAAWVPRPRVQADGSTWPAHPTH